MPAWRDAPLEEATNPVGSAPAATTAATTAPAWASAPLETAPAGGAGETPVTWRNRLQAGEAGILSGGAYLAGMIPDIPANIGALGISAYDVARHAMGTPWEELPRPWKPNITGATIAGLMNRSPITTTIPERPEDFTSRALYNLGSLVPGSILFGGGNFGGLEPAAPGGVLSVLGPSTRAFLGAVPAAAAGQTVQETRPFKEDWQNQLASGLTQLGVGYGLPALGKLTTRGPSTQQMEENLSAFQEAGAQPSLGQATGARRMQFLETALSKVPGGAGVLSKFAGRQATALRAGVQETIGGLSEQVGPEAAGEALIQGVKGPGGAVEQFQNRSEALFSDVDRYIPPQRPVPVTNTLTALEKLTAPIKGAEQTSAGLVNPKIASIRNNIIADVGEGQALPYEALSGVRTQVGSLLNKSELVSGVPQGQLKQLYGALSADMESAAQSHGPQAAAAWQRAQDYYSTTKPKIEQLQTMIDTTPEAVYRSAMAGTEYGATRLRTVLESIPQEQRNTMAATVLEKLGRSAPGQQNAEGTAYSPQTFLTNWNKMSASAKSALFGEQGTQLRDHLENGAHVAQNITEGSKVFQNVSGTAPAINQTEAFKNAMTLAAALLLGHGNIAGAAMGAIGVPGSAYLGAKAVTGPTMINWARQPIIGSASQMTALSQSPNMMENYQRLRAALGMGLTDLQQ